MRGHTAVAHWRVLSQIPQGEFPTFVLVVCAKGCKDGEHAVESILRCSPHNSNAAAAASTSLHVLA